MSQTRNYLDSLKSTDVFSNRHIGPSVEETAAMLAALNLRSLDELVDKTVPASIRRPSGLSPDLIGRGRSETEVLDELRELSKRNRIYRSFIGMGYSGCIVPPVILRNILENPGWYTQYTPYQAEIAQGRLEALLNFQTMVSDLTGMQIANASLLDEGTAAAEAMAMCQALHPAKGGDRPAFFASKGCHPQTLEILRTRAEPLGVEIIVGDHREFRFERAVFGVLLQYPTTDGLVLDYEGFIGKAHAAGALAVVAADILSLVLLKPPGELGADIAVGSTQRFGVPMGFGGPHAAYLATRDSYKRQIPGRLVGVSKDAEGRPAVRLALQTREQHIRRDKATSNICTAQVLLAVMASMYASYHGPEGLRAIARRVHASALALAEGLKQLGFEVPADPFFDTVRVRLGKKPLAELLSAAEARGINLRVLDAGDGASGSAAVCVALDETVTAQDIQDLWSVFGGKAAEGLKIQALQSVLQPLEETEFKRVSGYLSHPSFNRYHSETEMLRYLHRLQGKDLSLAHSMIPLGSCTMKLNATAEMIPVTWPEFGNIHPFVPKSQSQGYREMLERLEGMLREITGFDGVSLQPNAGSQGEYAGLLVIRKYHQSRGQGHRNVCLIPQSAHGTNPASAAMAGMKVVVTRCDDQGNVDLADLRAKAAEHAKDLSALMVTYPSTHGVFEESIREICEIIHGHGGQVYMDGANMNAQVGLCRPGDFGADVCHLNLHKTFCIPHGGGGPGMGPIGVKKHLAPYLPGHAQVAVGGDQAVGAVSSAPWGSASILPISYAYIALMGVDGLKRATEVAILNANYVARRLDAHYPVLYRGAKGFVAHECIVDLRPLKATSGVEVEDVAKRLMDYGFHAPTISFPVPGTMMIEPTESESKAELDRFCEAMIAIREEIREIEEGRADRAQNLLKLAPHTAEQISKTEWTRPYGRERAAFPLPWVRERKFWPAVARIDNVYGERNLMCSCAPLDAY